MGLPDEALTLRGGCNCGAVRYRISVPAKADRPASFALGPDPDLGDPNTPRLPYVVTCHCNDCRSASGHVPFQAFVCMSPMVTVSALPRDDAEEATRAVTGRIVERLEPGESADEDDAKRPPYLPSLDVLRPGLPGSKDTWLRFFHTTICNSEYFSRSFCGRCGTPIGYHWKILPEIMPPMIAQPKGWGDVMDIVLGTVDKEYLEQPWMAIERETNFEIGLPWAKRNAVTGVVALKYPGGFLTDVASEADLKRWAGGH